MKIALDNIIDSLGYALIVTDIKGKIIRMNPAAEFLTGFTAGEAIEKNFPEVFHFEEIASGITQENLIGQILKEGHVTWESGLLTTIDNRLCRIEGDGTPLKDTSGNFTGVVILFRKALNQGGNPKTPDPVATKQLEGIRKVIREDKGMITEDFSVIRGEPRWFHNSLQPIHDGSGQVAYVLLHSTDIHDLKTTQQELARLNRTLEERVREATSEIQDLYDHAPSGYHSLDAEGKFIMVNQTELNWLGYTREELIGKPFIQLLTAESLAVFYANFPLYKQRGFVHDLEFELIRKDGSTFPVLVSATAIRDELGTFVKSRSTMTDITARKQTEQALQIRESYLSAIIENQPGLIWLKDSNSRFLAVNRAFALSCGVKNPEDLAGKSDLDIWPVELAQKYRKDDADIMKEGKSRIVEEHIFDQGEMRWFETFKTPIFNQAGSVIGTTGYSRDITERKNAEDILKQTNAELQRAAKIKDEFLAHMSHELRTPLNAILGHSELLIRQFSGSLNERQLRYMKTIERSGRHLLELITGILDLSKLEARQMTLAPSTVVVSDICEASLIFIREMAGKKNIAITSQLDPNVELIEADGPRLKQMLVNLLSNAVKFTPDGGSVNLQVVGNEKSKMVSFSVSDTGIGISKEDMQRLFQPFVQLDSGLNRLYEGSGLGLTLVDRMAKLHGGNVSVQSEPGKGSRFTINLPWRSC